MYKVAIVKASTSSFWEFFHKTSRYQILKAIILRAKGLKISSDKIIWISFSDSCSPIRDEMNEFCGVPLLARINHVTYESQIIDSFRSYNFSSHCVPFWFLMFFPVFAGWSWYLLVNFTLLLIRPLGNWEANPNKSSNSNDNLMLKSSIWSIVPLW